MFEVIGVELVDYTKANGQRVQGSNVTIARPIPAERGVGVHPVTQFISERYMPYLTLISCVGSETQGFISEPLSNGKTIYTGISIQ